MRRDLDTASDAELLRLEDGDAFAVLYDRHVRLIFSWARARVGEHAADLTAEVFARAWLSRRRFKDEAGGSAFPWLHGIARNVLRDSLRKQRVESEARAKLGLSRELVPDPNFDAVDERRTLPEAVRAAVGGLPDAERELLRLRVVEERPYRDIAAQLACTPEAARVRVSRALRKLHLAHGGQRP